MSNKKKQLMLVLILSCLERLGFAGEVAESTDKIRLKAVAYEHGREGVRQDYRQAFALYCQAALEGDVESAYNIGFMYFNGRGVHRDSGLAMHWFKQAADGGDPHAKNMLVRFRDVEPVADNDCKPAKPAFRFVLESSPERQKVAAWVNQIALGYGIDPQLVMAVIQVESGFNSAALSGKNAQGLMQLIPETAERFGVKDTWNPIQNIKGGTAYLHWLLRHFDGKVEWVVAAYNAGEAAVERYHGVPPFQETRNYVKQIQSRYSKPLHPVPPERVENISLPEQKT
ncbi:MAG: transglycosylase SLT domain-containing protein [Methylococcales bacterium]|nr:transglycosylase SLT domain-containing protein [Methylococcales bacterium]